MKHQKLNDPLTEHLGRVQNEQNKPSKEEILAKVKSWVKDGIRSAEVRSRLSSDVYQMSDPEIDRLLAEVGNKNETEDKKENASDSTIISMINAAAEMFEPATPNELINYVMDHCEDAHGNGDLPGGMPSASKVALLVRERWDRLKKKHGLGKQNSDEDKKENAGGKNWSVGDMLISKSDHDLTAKVTKATDDDVWIRVTGGSVERLNRDGIDIEDWRKKA